jgi:hypothetical protein
MSVTREIPGAEFNFSIGKLLSNKAKRMAEVALQ